MLTVVLLVDLEAVAETVENCTDKISAAFEGSSIVEPNVGMEFDSEEAAKNFYDEYARQEGFVVRLDRCHRSEVDNRIISRRFSCNKQGFHVRVRNKTKPVHKPRTSIREGCEAMMLVKVNKCGKWVVTKFVKEHSHLLNASGSPSYSKMIVSFIFNSWRWIFSSPCLGIKIEYSFVFYFNLLQIGTTNVLWSSNSCLHTFNCWSNSL